MINRTSAYPTGQIVQRDVIEVRCVVAGRGTDLQVIMGLLKS